MNPPYGITGLWDATTVVILLECLKCKICDEGKDSVGNRFIIQSHHHPGECQYVEALGWIKRDRKNEIFTSGILLA